MKHRPSAGVPELLCAALSSLRLLQRDRIQAESSEANYFVRFSQNSCEVGLVVLSWDGVP